MVLFAPDQVGGLSYDGGLALLVASVVNLHHFVLDGVIWKLRNMRIASVLIRKTRDEPGAQAPIGPTSSWLRPVVWSVCGLALAIWTFVFVNSQIIYPAAHSRGDFVSQNQTVDRAGWFGFDSSKIRIDLGRRMARAGNSELAIVSLERGLADYPDVSGYRTLATLYQQQGDFEAAESSSF